MDERRIHFYLHPDTDAGAALSPWRAAGFAILSAWTVRSWRELHPHLGSRWNLQVHDDHCRSPRCPL